MKAALEAQLRALRAQLGGLQAELGGITSEMNSMSAPSGGGGEEEKVSVVEQEVEVEAEQEQEEENKKATGRKNLLVHRVGDDLSVAPADVEHYRVLSVGNESSHFNVSDTMVDTDHGQLP